MALSASIFAKVLSKIIFTSPPKNIKTGVLNIRKLNED
ncbi:hypothetical protein Solca_2884 [Solitalea canadensis DSM 3403]|uniref:Uncharacterized protein n=1 Tax=Solitalea canadensis (strain ATCC 29591 / DSM 3403 / JCM 21819 / LMG 8368 / NBRC 15130 / NCIMB 12057 / USAM 9D) TaxID=929556 RepID=H8KWB5_SOLCM|nr:hypothetical protein Solca_2884 [Solitalea canadensis DSM 3403]